MTALAERPVAMTARVLRKHRVRRTQFNVALQPFRVVAFGAGVQSLALLAWIWESTLKQERDDGSIWRGFFPEGLPDLILFADTQAENDGVYEAVERARQMAADAGIPFEVVTAGDLAHPRVASTGTQGIFVPLFTVSLEPRVEHVVTAVNPFEQSRWQELGTIIEDFGNIESAEDQADLDELLAEYDAIETHTIDVIVPPGEHGQLRRQCTSRYKIEPMMKRVYELAGDRKIEVWLGISTDEAQRAKTGPNDRVDYFYPLMFNQRAGADPDYIEHTPLAPINRNQCATHLIELEETPAKSACVFCPYRTDYSWAKMKAEDPKAFEQACQYDERMRNARPGYHCFVHRSRIPLREVVFEASAPQTIALFADMDMSQSGGCEEGFCGL